MSLNQVKLHLDWCSYKAAKFAVEHWHYSRCMPKSKNVYIGVWEDEKFIGAIIFGMGGGDATSGKRFGIGQFFRIAELERVALSTHKIAVTKIISIAIKMLKQQSPKLLMLISYADPRQKHFGIIYQAGNWIYYGRSAKTNIFIDEKGKEFHSRVISESGKVKQYGKYVKTRKRSELGKIKLEGKYTYLYPLDNEIKKQIELLRKPYPKQLCGNVVKEHNSLTSEKVAV